MRYPTPCNGTPAQNRALHLLLLLLRINQDQATCQLVHELVKGNVDWDLFFDLAFEHRVLPLIHQQIQATYTELFPSDIQADLKAEVFANTERNIVLSKKLLEAIAILQDHGIAALSFKGPTLAVMAYGNLSQRTFSDLDLLVPSDRFLEAKTALMQAGYQSAIASLFLITSESQENQLLCELGECPLKSANQTVHIDLHQRLIAGDFFRLTYPFVPAVWSRHQTITLLNQPIPTLLPEDLLLYLCIHGAKDLWKRLSWIYDVAAVLQSQPGQPEIDWDVLLAKARDHRLEQALWLGLTLTQTLLGIALPAAIESLRQQNFTQRALAQAVLMRLTQSFCVEDQQFSLVERFRFRFQILESPMDRLLCLTALYKTMTQPTYADTQFVHLDQPWQGLYRLVRPFRLLKELVTTSP